MRPPIATVARSLAAFFVMASAFAACKGPSEDNNDADVSGSADTLSDDERQRAEKEGECAPDETPEKVCKDLPDGTAECVFVCVPQHPPVPGCDPGTHPVKACKLADGPDS